MASNDLILLSSFLQNQQQEHNNETLRNIHQFLTGATRDTTLLTTNLELSATELKEKQLSDLKFLWSNTPFPAQTIGHMVRLHGFSARNLLEMNFIPPYE